MWTQSGLKQNIMMGICCTTERTWHLPCTIFPSARSNKNGAGATQSSFSSLYRVQTASNQPYGWWIISHFMISSLEIQQTSCYFIAFFMAKVQMNCIYSFQQFRIFQLGPPMPYTLGVGNYPHSLCIHF